MSVSPGSGGGTTGSDSDSDGSGLVSWGDIAPDWLTSRRAAITSLASVSGTLVYFGRNPEDFIFSVIWTRIVRHILNITTLVSDAILVVFFGSAETLGIAELPLYIAGLFVDAGQLVAVPILETIADLNAAIAAAAADAGLAAPVVLGGLQVAELIIGLVIAERAFRALASIIPPLERLIPGS